VTIATVLAFVREAVPLVELEAPMQVNVSGHHVAITDSLRGYVESKIERLERHFDLVSDVHCILTVEKLRHKAEAKVNVNGDTIFAETTDEDMYAAIDGLVDKLNRKVRKHKEKLVDHHARETLKREIS
jgi:putative sigma-54 modulation protein